MKIGYVSGSSNWTDRFKKKGRKGLGVIDKIINPIERMRFEHVVDKARNVMASVTRVADAVNEMGPYPKLRNYAALASIGVSSLMEHCQFDPYTNKHISYFAELDDVYEMVRDSCRDLKNTKSFGKGKEMIFVAKINDETIVFHDEHERIFYINRDVEDQRTSVMHAIGRNLWETFGGKIEMMSKGSMTAVTRGDQATLLRSWSLGDILVSDQTTTVGDRIQSFLSRNYSRAIMLHGPPGTGKSCMARAIASRFNMPTLFISAASTAAMTATELSLTLSMLAPYIVIIDDLDRVEGVGSLLSIVDRIHATARIFVATVNYIDRFDPAIVRAGRFDEIIEVLRVVAPSSMIARLPSDIAEEIDGWPVSFIEELRRRLDVVGMENIEREMETMRPWMDSQNSKFYGDDEE